MSIRFRNPSSNGTSGNSGTASIYRRLRHSLSKNGQSLLGFLGFRTMLGTSFLGVLSPYRLRLDLDNFDRESDGFMPRALIDADELSIELPI